MFAEIQKELKVNSAVVAELKGFQAKADADAASRRAVLPSAAVPAC